MTEFNTSCVVYPDELEKEIIKNKYIPRKCRELEHLKLYHRYYTTRYGVFKVENIESIKGIEYYFIKYNNGKLFGVISHPITDTIYELLHDYDEIEKVNLINSNKSYSGAEIKFWFVINNINFKDQKYDGFLSFLNANSKNIISDSKYYFVYRNKSKRLKFQMILDKSKEKL